MRLQAHQLKALRSWESLPEPRAEFVMPVPMARKKRSNEESQMQRQLILWWHRQCRVFGVPELCLFSIPNGGARTAITGAVLKAEGARKGVPDLMLAVSRRPRPVRFETTPHFNGLFLELKRREGVLSPEQEVYHGILRKQGYEVVVVWSLMEGIQEITKYLT